MVVKKDFMDMGQNGRIKKKRGRRWFGEEDRNGCGSKKENREKEGNDRILKKDRNGYGSKWKMGE